MDKEYIPKRGVCYNCGDKSVGPAKAKPGTWQPYHMVGFRAKPQRWVFCHPCFEKWTVFAHMKNEGKCPRKQIFKAVAGKEVI